MLAKKRKTKTKSEIERGSARRKAKAEAMKAKASKGCVGVLCKDPKTGRTVVVYSKKCPRGMIEELAEGVSSKGTDFRHPSGKRPSYVPADAWREMGGEDD